MKAAITDYGRYAAAVALAAVGLHGVLRPFVSVAVGAEPLRVIGWRLILSSLLWDRSPPRLCAGVEGKRQQR